MADSRITGLPAPTGGALNSTHRFVLDNGTDASAVQATPGQVSTLLGITGTAFSQTTAWTGSGTGGTTRSTQNRFEDLVVNVKTFGALGDGSTNDQAAVQAAHNYVLAAGAGTLYFPKGDYHIRPSIDLNGAGGNTGTLCQSVRWQGAGRYKTLLSFDRTDGASTDSDVNMVYGVIAGMSGSNSSIESSTFADMSVYAPAHGAAFLMLNNFGVTFENVESHYGRYPFAMCGSIGQRFEHCKFWQALRSVWGRNADIGLLDLHLHPRYHLDPTIYWNDQFSAHRCSWVDVGATNDRGFAGILDMGGHDSEATREIIDCSINGDRDYWIVGRKMSGIHIQGGFSEDCPTPVYIIANNDTTGNLPGTTYAKSNFPDGWTFICNIHDLQITNAGKTAFQLNDVRTAHVHDLIVSNQRRVCSATGATRLVLERVWDVSSDRLNLSCDDTTGEVQVVWRGPKPTRGIVPSGSILWADDSTNGRGKAVVSMARSTGAVFESTWTAGQTYGSNTWLQLSNGRVVRVVTAGGGTVSSGQEPTSLTTIDQTVTMSDGYVYMLEATSTVSWVDVLPAGRATQQLTSATSLSVSDNAAQDVAAGTFTLTVPSAATLTDGFRYRLVRASGTVTIDGPGATNPTLSAGMAEILAINGAVYAVINGVTTLIS